MFKEMHELREIVRNYVGAPGIEVGARLDQRVAPAGANQKTINGRLEDILMQSGRHVEHLESMNGRYFGEPQPASTNSAAGCSPYGIPSTLTAIELNLERIGNLLEYLDSHF